MITLLAQTPEAPEIAYRELSPLLALVVGAVVVLMVGLFRSPFVRLTLVPALTAVALLTAIGLTIWIWEPGDQPPIIEGALAVDTLALGMSMLFYVAGLVAIVLSLRANAPREAGHGEYHSLLLGSIAGMVVLASAENLITLFIGIELLSIPLYVLCATELRKRESLEAGLKYLVIGSVGSATLLYGLAMIYGATGTMQFGQIASALGGGGELSVTDPLLLTGIGLTIVGLAFKASVAPFHQWTPDVYQGAPTPITTFMAVATKAAAFGIFLRLFYEALGLAQLDWAPALAILAATTIVIGNVGALAQRSLKRMLAWSSIAQAGYLLVGVVVGTRLGLEATAFYLAVYLAMNVTAFAVVVARERVSEHGDDLVLVREPRADQPVARLADDDRHAVAGRLPCHGRLHRQVLPDRRRRVRRLHLARNRDRGRVGPVAGVLPACGGGDVDGSLRDRDAERPAPAREARRRLVTRGRHPRPARGGAGGDPVRGADDLLRALARSAVRRGPGRGHELRAVEVAGASPRTRPRGAVAQPPAKPAAPKDSPRGQTPNPAAQPRLRPPDPKLALGSEPRSARQAPSVRWSSSRAISLGDRPGHRRKPTCGCIVCACM